jgi:hypothetical protein
MRRSPLMHWQHKHAHLAPIHLRGHSLPPSRARELVRAAMPCLSIPVDSVHATTRNVLHCKCYTSVDRVRVGPVCLTQEPAPQAGTDDSDGPQIQALLEEIEEDEEVSAALRR